MASTKRSALASNPIVDVTALHQYNTTNFVQYASLEQASSQQAASNKRLKSQAKVSSSEQQASSPEQRASSNKPRASSSKTSFPS
jgi:hypothetical protein